VGGTSAVTASGSNGASGVQASSDSGFGLVGQSTGGKGVFGQSGTGIGVNGSSNSGPGVFGQSISGPGVRGQSSAGPAGEFFGDVNVKGHLSGGAGTFASSVAGTHALTASGTTGATGLQGSSDTGFGLVGQSSSGRGVLGESSTGVGVEGSSGPGPGVVGTSGSGSGIRGQSASGLAGEFLGNVSVTGILSRPFGSVIPPTPAMIAKGATGAAGVQASSDSGPGIVGVSNSNSGVRGQSNTGLAGEFEGNVRITGTLNSSAGTFASSVQNTPAITANGTSGAYGVQASSDTDTGVQGSGITGVNGASNSGTGVLGTSFSGTGVVGVTGKGLAGEFDGNVRISGTLSKAGGGFTIDHPLDPAHKYLSHSFVESADMKNLYDGVVTLDAQGQAEVALPTWFEALNADFCYQLTAIGTSAPNLYIAEEITDNRFRIAGGQPGMKVCWLVSAVRQDAWATAHRMVVEQDKPTKEQGFYLHPELYGQSEQQSVIRVRYPNLRRLSETL
jgi:hypothetical protein